MADGDAELLGDARAHLVPHHEAGPLEGRHVERRLCRVLRHRERIVPVGQHGRRAQRRIDDRAPGLAARGFRALAPAVEHDGGGAGGFSGRARGGGKLLRGVPTFVALGGIGLRRRLGALGAADGSRPGAEMAPLRLAPHGAADVALRHRIDGVQPADAAQPFGDALDEVGGILRHSQIPPGSRDRR